MRRRDVQNNRPACGLLPRLRRLAASLLISGLFETHPYVQFLFLRLNLIAINELNEIASISAARIPIKMKGSLLQFDPIR